MHQALPSQSVRAVTALTDAVDAALLVHFNQRSIPAADSKSAPTASIMRAEADRTGARMTALDLDPVSPRWS